ncbi:pentapeptide repeat-containing protein [Scytonema hofmannii FACHB-248]|uniref:Pentapeptide repeat-containing protein n=1 Tax=Scytonema hofmannii FACHB-248 TaxID=1842502 RepID=A0ABR8GQI2_9CYAN|nr:MULTISPECIES: pentapeptide repeat-containing protein [Nostocales]MBD2605700.1 pentapeptide repeat-containing protein [Scytonema hofmannii FACHB-248]
MKKNIRGQRFYQELLPTTLQNVIAGQTTILKIIMIAVSIMLGIVSAGVAGFLGSVICLEVIASSDPQSRFSYFCMTLVIVAWMIATLKLGIIKGLFVAVISTLIAVIVAVIISVKLGLNDFPGKVFLVITIFTSLAIFSFFVNRFSIYLNNALLNKNLRFLNNIFAYIFVSTAIFISYNFLFSTENSQYIEKFYQSRLLIINLPFSQIKYIGVLCGGIAGLSMTIASLRAIDLDKNRNNSDFLKLWAIAAASWGGTSFYNLDLSNVDFTNSELQNTDFRAIKLYRTCLKHVKGLDRARLDNQYLDLSNPQVQKLLINGSSEDTDFNRINLQGAYLRNADMRHYKFIETNLNGADLQDADLRGSILVRAQVTGVDFTGAKLTGICIEDWSANSKTCFARVECDYIYRKLDEKGEGTERYPVDRNFEKGEFEALFQEVEEVVELVFKEGINWRALSFTFRQLQLEDDGLGLEIKGVEKRGDLWVVKVTHKEGIPRQEVEQRVIPIYNLLEKQITIMGQALDKALMIGANQSEALKELSKKPFGNIFSITGSTITNLAGSGEINYDEAASNIRNIVANSSDLTQANSAIQSLLQKLKNQSIAISADEQAELIRQVILSEAKKDPFFKQFFMQQGQQIADAMPESAIATAIREAYSQLT